MLRGTPVFATFCVVSPPFALGIRARRGHAPRETRQVSRPHLPFASLETLRLLDTVITNVLNREL
jgi:hypothetical protein